VTRANAIAAATAHVVATLYDKAEAVDSFPLPAFATWCVLVEVRDNCGRALRFGVVVERGVVAQEDVGDWAYFGAKSKYAGRAAWAERLGT
jgi:hypothetical protein